MKQTKVVRRWVIPFYPILNITAIKFETTMTHKERRTAVALDPERAVYLLLNAIAPSHKLKTNRNKNPWKITTCSERKRKQKNAGVSARIFSLRNSPSFKPVEIRSHVAVHDVCHPEE